MTETAELPDLNETEVETLAEWLDDQALALRDDLRVQASDTELRVLFYQGFVHTDSRYADPNEFTDKQDWIKWLTELR